MFSTHKRSKRITRSNSMPYDITKRSTPLHHGTPKGHFSRHFSLSHLFSLDSAPKKCFTESMKKHFSSLLGRMAIFGLCAGSAMGIEKDTTSNGVFDLYFFGNGETGIFGTTRYDGLDSYRQTSGVVKERNGSVIGWSDDYKQAMINAVNTWTNAISTEYDLRTEDNPDGKHSRKLRIGFFLDDGTSGGVMSTSMAGYATTQIVTTQFEPEYGSQANIYSVAEWAWRDNNVTDYYSPSWVMSGTYWETKILSEEESSIDMAIVLNPVILSYGFDANNIHYWNETVRSAEEMQNIATHEIGHGMGINSDLYEQKWDQNSWESKSVLTGYVSTWDSLITIEGENIVNLEEAAQGGDYTQYDSLNDIQAAAWYCEPGKDATNPQSYTGNEIQYDPERRLSLENEDYKLGLHISAIQLEGDTMEHLLSEGVTNVLGPGGTSVSTFSEHDLQALEMLGWEINWPAVPEPSTATLSLMALTALAMRRRRK